MTREQSKRRGLRPLFSLVAHASVAVDNAVMGEGPGEAIPAALGKADMTLADMDLIDVNEAFAAQALSVIQEAGLNPETVNVNGGALALGHPLGCTGTKLSIQLLEEMKLRNQRYGMVTACVGGGQGIAGIFERL